MATYTSIPTFTSGQVLTSSVMNNVKNNLDLGNAQSAYPYRNLLYNGAMQISQRRAVGSAATGNTTSGFYTADRFQHIISSLGTWTDTTIAEAPTGSGFRNSFKVECTTADASPAAGDYMLVRQQLEGQDLQRIRKGTSSAQPLVLTFWVRSNVTGTYIVELEDLDNTRSISKSYTVSASATWQQVEISFAADTTGALDNDNNASMSLNFWLGAGTTYTSGTLATNWGAQTNANRAVGQVNLASATSQYWQVTGVQLEVGSVSTPFEFLPFGDDLAKCQRYYQKSYDLGVAPGTALVFGGYCAVSTGATYPENQAGVRFATMMRAAPVVTIYSTGTGAANKANDANAGADVNAGGYNIGQSGFVVGGWAAVSTRGYTYHWTASAEL